MGYVAGVTERKRIREILKSTDDMLTSVLNNMSEAMLIRIKLMEL